MALIRATRTRRWAAAAVAAGLVTALVATAPASAAPENNDDVHPARPAQVKTGFAKVADGVKFANPLNKDPNAVEQVYIQFAGTSAAAASAARGGTGAVAASAAKAKRSAISATAAAVDRSLKAKDPNARVLYRTSNALPGVAVVAKAGALKELAAREDVAKITRLVPKKVSNSNAAQLTKVLNTWQSTGLLGDGVTIGVIDTGVDYTHADFGGAGTVEAFDAAKAATTFAGTPKVIGGYDFAGDDYNASPTDPNFQPIPHPDANPLDCGGHGSHVAGTAAGVGVNADGTPFTGDYTSLTSAALNAMKIGPGMAPKASIVALKVFGCEGSTSLVGQALDWALDPNGDGDFSDKLDVINLSLGSDYGPEDDPENDLINALAKFGVLPVIAMGNGGDFTDIGGTPGNAIGSLAVANSLDSYQLMDGIRVTAPADVAKVYGGQNSVAYDWTSAPVSGPVVAIPGSNADGCSVFSASDAALVTGKVAWLEWDDNDATRACGSAARAANARTAGAIGAIFTSSSDAFAAGITGDAEIPVFQFTGPGTAAVRPALEAGTLAVTFDGTLAAATADYNDALTDSVAVSTSRGTHNAISVVKPDVAAPGSTIASVKVGSGTGVTSMTGTSMATPHVAGIAALVKQIHPTWTSEQVKAAVMNTASGDVYTGLNKTGNKLGPARVGAGRVDALAATTTEVIAYNTNRPQGVSASFGIVWVNANVPTMTKTETIKVENTGRTGANYKVSYDPIVSTPGVSYSVTPASLFVGPKSSRTVTVTMKITTSQLDHTIDPSMAATQINPLTGLEEARQYVTDASGRVLLQQVNKPTLRVPVYGVVKPVSTTKAAKGTLGGKPAVTLSGKGVNSGITSLVSVMQLGGRSVPKPACSATVTTNCNANFTDKAADLQWLGVGSTKGSAGWSDGFLWFGLSTYGNWATLGANAIPYVDIDVDGDGQWDFEVQAQALSTATGGGTDLVSAVLIDLSTQSAVGIAPVNFNYGDVDTNVNDGNAVLLPVDPAALGITPSTQNFVINYRAAIFNAFTGTDTDTIVGAPYDVMNPRVGVSAPLYIDEDKAAIPYTLSSAATVNDRILVLHLNGRPNARAELLVAKP